MLITLPDNSLVLLDAGTLRFTLIDGFEAKRVMAEHDPQSVDSPFNVNCEKLAEFMEKPSWKFGDSFRRISDHPRYSPKQSVHEFNISAITRIYQFSGTYQGVTFSSSSTEWKFLDGGIISQNGYGRGGHSWTVVEGAEALRVVCLFFGVKQPRKIKGEIQRRSLAQLLEEMTKVPLQNATKLLSNLPKPFD